MFIALSRTLKESLRNLTRNGWLSIASISILLFSLYILSVIMIVSFAANVVIQDIQDKVNVSIYFKSDVGEVDVMKVKTDLEGFREIKSVEYVSKEKALEDFKISNANEPAILKSLEEIGENPLLSSLVVKAHDPAKYESISEYVNKADFSENISRVNYGKNKEIIDRLSGIISQVKKVGLILIGIFSLISILITFNTIRINIYTHKQEIEVMRLVGASNTFIRLPFIFDGVIYGLIASILSMVILLGTMQFLRSYIPGLMLPRDLNSIYFDNFAVLIGVQVITGVVLGVISSLIAIRKYLKI